MARNATTTEATASPAKEIATLSAKEMATELETDPKSFRRFLRALTDDRAGKGGRWVFDAETADLIRTAWAAKAAKGTTPTISDDEG